MGKRGEGWVIVQLLLFAAIIFAPHIELFALPLWLRVLGVVLVAIGGLTAIAAVLALGTNLTPFPKPIEGGQLVTSGAYALVRHPIYTGLIFAACGWALWNTNVLGIVLAGALLLFFDIKSRREERWLMDAYPGYASYRRRVKKLIPWVY